MRKYLKALFILIFFVGCSQNLFNEFADRDTDDALIYDAKRAVNNSSYDDAIAILTTKLSLNGQTKVAARETLASAYAGKCGLNFLNFVAGLAAATSGSVFVLATTPFVGVPVNSGFCLQSLQTLDLIGPNSTRTNEQNAFASIVGMVLMGSAARLYTDNAPVNGDGAQDAPNISCSLNDTQIDQVILGYGYMSANFSALSSSQIGSSSSAAISGSIGVCTSIAGATCQITDPAAITAPLRDAMRDLLNTVTYGVGTADGSSLPLVAVACP